MALYGLEESARHAAGGGNQPGLKHYFFQISESDLLSFFEWPGVESVDGAAGQSLILHGLHHLLVIAPVMDHDGQAGLPW
jgi:hypothetical protein